MFIISTYSNYLTVSLREGDNLVEKSIPLELSILENSNIKLVDDFKKILYNVLYDMKGLSYKNIPVVFIVDPIKVDFRFYKNSKDISEEDSISNLFEEIGKSKESVYYSIQKKSPLFSQFVAINKNDLDIYEYLASELGLKVKGIFSYLSLLTKYVNHPGNLILVSSYLGNIVLTISEQSSIYFNTMYGSFRDVSNIKKLVENLKMFKNNGRNSEIFSFNFENPEITSKLNITEVEFFNDYGYLNPIHALSDVTLELFANDIYQTNYNLADLSPSVSEEEVKKKVPVLKYAFMMIFSLIIGSSAYYLSYVNPAILENVLGSSSSSENSEEILEQPKSPAGSDLTFPRVNAPLEVVSSPDVTLGENVDLTAPTSTASLPKDTIKVQVLNSTGVTGLARTKADLMKSLGYKNVVVGDTKPAIQGTLMKVKPEYLPYRDAFLKELITFTDLKIEENTDKEVKFDIIVVLGR